MDVLCKYTDSTRDHSLYLIGSTWKTAPRAQAGGDRGDRGPRANPAARAGRANRSPPQRSLDVPRAAALAGAHGARLIAIRRERFKAAVGPHPLQESAVAPAVRRRAGDAAALDTGSAGRLARALVARPGGSTLAVALGARDLAPLAREDAVLAHARRGGGEARERGAEDVGVLDEDGHDRDEKRNAPGRCSEWKAHRVCGAGVV
jgi:hypothetical protein